MTRAGPAERIVFYVLCGLFSLLCWAAVCVVIWRAVQWIGGGP